MSASAVEDPVGQCPVAPLDVLPRAAGRADRVAGGAAPLVEDRAEPVLLRLGLPEVRLGRRERGGVGSGQRVAQRHARRSRPRCSSDVLAQAADARRSRPPRPARRDLPIASVVSLRSSSVGRPQRCGDRERSSDRAARQAEDRPGRRIFLRVCVRRTQGRAPVHPGRASIRRRATHAELGFEQRLEVGRAGAVERDVQPEQRRRAVGDLARAPADVGERVPGDLLLRVGVERDDADQPPLRGA